jgi:thiol-disulfide isomerase/thioredoxin
LRQPITIPDVITCGIAAGGVQGFDWSSNKKPVMYLFNQPWCGACNALKADFKENEDDMLEISKNFILINVGGDDNNDFAVKHTLLLLGHIELDPLTYLLEDYKLKPVTTNVRMKNPNVGLLCLIILSFCVHVHTLGPAKCVS